MSEIKIDVIESPFGLAPVRREGESVWDEELWGPKPEYVKPKYETDWFERRVPEELYEEAHDVLDKWLISKGIDLNEL